MSDLSLRQSKILAAVVKEYCDNGEPVASGDLLAKYDFDVSAATIRNEMQELEEKGYLQQPHTSAGRIPSDAGFRFFVNELMHRTKLSLQEQERLRREVVKLSAMNIELGKRLAKLMAEVSSNAAFAVLPGETSASGLSHILNQNQLPAEDVKEIAEFFDNIDNYADDLIEKYKDSDPTTIIGKEIEIGKSKDYSMIVSGLQLPSGKKGVVGLIGPKNMKYEKNFSLMEYISKLIKP